MSPAPVARDLAAWTLDTSVHGLGGAYNLVSPPGETSGAPIREDLSRCGLDPDTEARFLSGE
ncbi:hypothetical protein OG689_31535 [Kitasatospora sp. NBC_00240]|uniref:hypothetical protein n=1 Tax=Kitasatospora sp. NBC_00240 TaxID=2903567 RepID=UPI00225BA8CA|nr:hypothetical protein [Kitasatospora sp. NBC_00240]MCX5213750.1 hypothetical protein [Kitasatospora sp. NBC_00240]